MRSRYAASVVLHSALPAVFSTLLKPPVRKVLAKNCSGSR
jgi:hypothetical protein